ncbi:type VI secretion system tip protein VgrG [Aestuariicella sp. G3-2]|nr:type VI secretion system tip protein VgrG [Aestuariicella albida]
MGESKFIATYLSGQEFVSDLFRFDVELFSDDHEIQQQDVVGHALTLSIYNNGEDNPRIIHGYVNQFACYDVDASGMRCYRATVVPGFWFLTLGAKNRVFHSKSVKSIIEEVLGEYKKVVSYSIKVDKQHTDNREYCVQFDESDYDFVHRLMAEEGISYYFKHTKGKHELILTDGIKDYFDCCKQDIEYDGGGSQPDKCTVHRWQREFSYHTGGFEFKDYNEFTTSKDNLKSGSTKNNLNDVSSYKTQRYGRYQFEIDGENKHKFNDGVNKEVVDRALEFQEMGFDVGRGASDVVDFAAGGKFTLEHPISSEKGNYLLMQVKMVASDGNNRETSFKNEFICVPSDVTPRPDPSGFAKQIHHPQLATVKEVRANPTSGGQDTFTQVKVVFPWNSRQNSCWIRVVQSYAGKNWGANFVPRKDQEVVVTFINGDPERPLVTGAVYNGTNTGPKYTSTQSGWKTEFDDSKFNELKFDDKPGEEEIYMEAGRDHNFLIHNDQSGKIENDQSLEVVNNRSITVSKGNESKTVSKGTQTVDVQGAIKITSKTSITLKVGGSSIKIDPAGITLKAAKIDSKASAMSTVKAGGVLTLKGALTKIN